MSRLTQKEKAVAARLRQEFAASRPEFSEALHDRLCRAVRRQPSRPPQRGAGMDFPVGPRLPQRPVCWSRLCRLARDQRRSGRRAASVAGVQRASMGSMTGLADEVVAKTGATVDAAVKAQLGPIWTRTPNSRWKCRLRGCPLTFGVVPAVDAAANGILALPRPAPRHTLTKTAFGDKPVWETNERWLSRPHVP